MKLTAQTITKDAKLKYRQVKCKLCNGTGWENTISLTSTRCKKCNGEGLRLFPVGSTEKCPVCEGRGKDYRLASTGTVCEECDGFGEIKLLTQKTVKSANLN